MKYCGCPTCRRNGEVNPHELFEEYLRAQNPQDAIDSEFEDIFRVSYTVGEMTDLYDKYEESFLEREIPNRINQINAKPIDAINHWYGYNAMGNTPFGNLIHFWMMGGDI